MLSKGLSDGRARALNLALLIGGYGIGQGAIFLAQSWLVATGRLELLALFGTHFAFAVFGLMVVEAGSLTILARHAASMEHGEETAPALWRTFWEMSVVRAALAVLVIAAGLVFARVADEPFTGAFALYAAPAFAVWALSAGGVLDGLRLSGISGVSGSLPYAACAGALLLAQDRDPAAAGALLGAAFSLGYALTVLVQFGALRALGRRPRLVRPHRAGVIAAARDGLLLLGSTLPGQVHYRVQLLMSAAWLGPAPTALFVYIKQIVSAITQLIGFIRRVEFPALVRSLQRSADPLKTAWTMQTNGTIIAAIATALVALAGLSFAALGKELNPYLGMYLAAFAPSIITTAVFMALSQSLVALGRYGALLTRSTVATAVGITASALFISDFGVFAFALADILATGTSIALIYRELRKELPDA